MVFVIYDSRMSQFDYARVEGSQCGENFQNAHVSTMVRKLNLTNCGIYSTKHHVSYL
jgi:hypothetical protein